MLEAAGFKFAADTIKHLYRNLKDIKGEREAELEEIARQFGDPRHWINNYIEPECQQFNPADEDEEISHVIKTPLLGQLQKFIDESGRIGKNQLFLLADAGMGKTCSMVSLRLLHLNSFFPKGYECVLLKLGEDTIDVINGLNVRNTVLLLDGLDEDPLAWGRVRHRIEELLKATTAFFRVIITCRTQFFSAGEDPFNRRGQVEVGGFLCPVLYLSLFSEKQVSEYLSSKYVQDLELIEKSKQILDKVHSLKFRPMLLAHIDDLLESEFEEYREYDLYQALIKSWLCREYRKRQCESHDVEIASPIEMERACMHLSKFLFENDTRTLEQESIDLAISYLPIPSFLSSMDLGGRSFMNKDSSDRFRFSHLSIQEWLCVKGFLEKEFQAKNNKKIKCTDLMFLFLSQGLEGRNCNQYDISMFDMSGLKISSFDFRMVSNRYRNCLISKSKVDSCKILNVDIEKSDFSGTFFSRCRIGGGKFLNLNLTSTSFDNTKFLKQRFSEVDFEMAFFERVSFEKSYFNKCNLKIERSDSLIFKYVDINNSRLEIVDGGAAIEVSKVELCEYFGENFFSRALNVEFIGCSFINVNFDSESLSGVRFLKCEFLSCSFDELHSGYRRNVKFEDCSFDSKIPVNTEEVKVIFDGVVASKGLDRYDFTEDSSVVENLSRETL